MRELLFLAIHLLVTVAKLMRPGGARAVAAESPLLKHQLLISDGLDRDVGAEMERLHKSCRKLVWLNPLLRYEGFQPRPSGVRAMLPQLDAFMPVHNIYSLAELARELKHGKWQHHSGRMAA